MARALWARARELVSRAGYSGVFTVSAALGAVPVYQRFGFVASGPVTTEHGVARLPMTTR
ncbi:GNAT family N-acetyltransferase [Pseudomonas aeruginosa]|nr:GNAT family N-acetyltransferase [Pseudomonas aeruginosa]